MEHGILPHEYAKLERREKAIMIAQLQIEEKRRKKQERQNRRRSKKRV